jgi:RNA polymerase sigma-70 factor (ECF subfamily)
MVRTRRASGPDEAPRLDPPVPDADQRMGELYELHGLALYRFLQRWSYGQPETAEDLMQKALARAGKNLQHLDADLTTIRPWLFTVARRIAIDSSRAQKARPAEVGMEDMSGRPDTADDLKRMLGAEAVQRALQGISADHRRVLVEVYYRGRSIDETAEVLGIPVRNVKSRAYHALRALRAAMGARSS